MDTTAQKKLFISFIVIIVGFVGYWMVQSFSGMRDVKQPSVVVSSTESGTSFFDSQITQQTIRGTQRSAVNITNEAISDLSQEIISSIQNAQTTSSEDMIAAIEKTDIANIDSKTMQKYADATHLGLLESITDDQLKVIKTSDAARVKYKEEYTHVVSAMTSFISGNISSDFMKFMQENDSTGLDNTIKIYDNIYSALYTLEVPQNALAFHKESILFFGNMTTILQGVRDYQIDPLRAYLLGERFNTMASAWERIVSNFNTI